LKRKPPGTSTVPSSTCSTWIARQVWKPFEWARDAAHGVHGDRAARASSRGGAPQSVHGMFGVRADWSKADIRELGRDAAGSIGRHAAAFGHRLGRILRVEIAFRQKVEHRHARAAHRRP
jgi:hypothetical protein